VFRCDPTTPVSQAVVQLSLRPSHDVAVVAAAHGAVGAGRLKAQAQAQAPHDCHQRTAAGCYCLPLQQQRPHEERGPGRLI
jgi:hypothetical protein